MSIALGGTVCLDAVDCGLDVLVGLLPVASLLLLAFGSVGLLSRYKEKSRSRSAFAAVLALGVVVGILALAYDAI